MWATVSRHFKRGRKRSHESDLRLVEAYRTVFRSQDGQMVLADLANKSGVYRATEAGSTSNEQIWQQEGKRLLFLQTMGLLDLTDQQLDDLRQAARQEALIDMDQSENQQQGIY